MPKLKEMFPSNYMKCDDLDGDDLIVTIKKVVQEKIGTDEKWIVYFKGQEKGLVLNKTNAQTIEALYGEDSDDWIGKRITLFPTKVTFEGKLTGCIRIKEKAPKPAKPETAAESDDTDEAPF